jgi:hypothetical protein
MSDLVEKVEACLDDLAQRLPGAVLQVFVRQKGGHKTLRWEGRLEQFGEIIGKFCVMCPKCSVSYSPDNPYLVVLKMTGGCTAQSKACSGPPCLGPDESPHLMVWVSQNAESETLVGRHIIPSVMVEYEL